MKVTIQHEVSPQRICDLFTSAFEGGITYWAQTANLVRGTTDAKENVVWWGQPIVFDNPFVIELLYDDPDDDGGEGNGKGRATINNPAVKRGLQIMADRYPAHFADILNDNEDATTADVFVQCIVFADKPDPLIYG